jgi:hypothetical protein
MRRAGTLTSWRKTAGVLLLVAVWGLGVGQTPAKAQKSQDLTITVDQDTYFGLSEGPTVTLSELNTFVEVSSSYTFENNICGQGNGKGKGKGRKNKECWRVDANIASGDLPEGITLDVEMEAPGTEKPQFNDPESLGRKTLAESPSVQLLDDIGNTSEQGLDITYWVEASPEAAPTEYIVTVVYTLSRR